MSAAARKAADDATDVIALARQYGLTGIRPATDPAAPVGVAPAAPAVDTSGAEGVIALARQYGLAGIRPATDPATEVGAAPTVPPVDTSGAEDVIALARHHGVGGIRPAIVPAREVSTAPPAPDVDTSGAGDVIALARQFGISGIRPATAVAPNTATIPPPPLSAASARPPASAVTPPVAATPAPRVAPAPAARQIQSGQPALARPFKPSVYARFAIHGTAGALALKEWEAAHGSLTGPGANNEWTHVDTRYVIFSFPDRQTLSQVSAHQGNLDSEDLRFDLVTSIGQPRAAALPPPKTPPLPHHLLKALTG